MKNYSILLLILALLLNACFRDDAGITFSLPAKTRSGQHTFGVLLDAEVWTNYGKVCFPFVSGCRENLNGLFFPNDGDLLITADKILYTKNRWAIQETIDLNLRTNFKGERTYSTLFKDSLSVAYSRAEPGQPEKTYLLSYNKPDFTIIITKIDPLNKIMSGEFSGTLFRRIDEQSFATSTTDSIVLKEGRFDIRLK